MSRIDALLTSIRETCASSAGLIVPVSGGSDSALCFWLLNQVYPDKVVAMHAGKELREQAWFQHVGIVEFIETPGEYPEREEMRWARFMAIALSRRAWLVGCRNRTEQELGTYSLASRIATYLPIVGVWKSTVLELCQEVGVPSSIIQSSLRADPDCGRPQSLAEIPYEVVERFLRVRNGELSLQELKQLFPGQVEYLDRIYAGNGFKQGLPLRGPNI